jgi:peptide/nickel transport system ATP-binding protein
MASETTTPVPSSPPPSRGRPSYGHRPSSAVRPRLTGRMAIPATSARPTRAERVRATGPGGGRLVLDVKDLRTYFFTYDGVVRALEGVDLQASSGETTGVVGETGCGKSVTAFSIARLISDPGRVISGRVTLNGMNLLWGLDKEAKFKRDPRSNRVKVIRHFRAIRATNERMSAVRGRGVGMIFQEPMQAMNPVFSIADQLGEAVMQHRALEVIDGLLRADRSAPALDIVGHSELAAESDHRAENLTAGGLGQQVEQLLQSGISGRPEEVRAAAGAIAKTVGLPSLEAELFHTVRNAASQPGVLRRRVERALRRVYMSGLQRAYLRHQRRLEGLRARLKEAYLQEMKTGKPQRATRGTLGLRIRAEKLAHFYYSLWGIGRRASKPLKNELFWRAVELLEGVRIANPAQVARGYPHELSGGMLQRAMIAMALSCEPQLLLADEPTTALDVTIQAQILELMHQLRERVGTAIVLITHDLGVVAEVCDRLNVMYAGVVVESGPVGEVFRRPLHPYTHGLLGSIPRLDRPDLDLVSIPGSVPNLVHPPPGCRFHPRCPYAMPICREVRPDMQTMEGGHQVACHLYNGSEPAAEGLADLPPVASTVGASGPTPVS